jgi:hypothetical protein
MLLCVISMAVAVTLCVTSATEPENSQVRAGKATTTNLHKGPYKTIVYSLSYIPAGSKIEGKQLETRETAELEAWDDAEQSVSGVVGGTAKHAIPAYTQIRKVDLEY